MVVLLKRSYLLFPGPLPDNSFPQAKQPPTPPPPPPPPPIVNIFLYSEPLIKTKKYSSRELFKAISFCDQKITISGSD